MTPVIPGFYQQTAYSRRRICVPGFLAELLNFELVDQIWGVGIVKKRRS